MESSEHWSVADVPAAGRYELRRRGELIGFGSYTLRDDVLVVPHVETLAAHRGHRYSELLMAGIVDDARERSLHIDPVCSHFAAYLRNRTDTANIPNTAGGS